MKLKNLIICCLLLSIAGTNSAQITKILETQVDSNQVLFNYFTNQLKYKIEVNQQLKSLVYTFYNNRGYNAIYKIDEQINLVPTNKESRDLLFRDFILKTFDGKKDAIIDFLYVGVGLNIPSAKKLGEYIVNNYSDYNDGSIQKPSPDLFYMGNNNNQKVADSTNTQIQIKGRKAKILTKPVYSGHEEGVVVVKITIDKMGNVLKAIGGYKGSTTINKMLIKVSEDAAMRSQFSPDANAPEEEEGTITYQFVNK